MPQVKLKENEPFDIAIRRFKRACEKAVSWLKCGDGSSTRSRLLSESEKLRLPLSAISKNFKEKIEKVSVYTSLLFFIFTHS